MGAGGSAGSTAAKASTPSAVKTGQTWLQRDLSRQPLEPQQRQLAGKLQPATQSSTGPRVVGSRSYRNATRPRLSGGYASTAGSTTAAPPRAGRAGYPLALAVAPASTVATGQCNSARRKPWLPADPTGLPPLRPSENKGRRSLELTNLEPGQFAAASLVAQMASEYWRLEARRPGSAPGTTSTATATSTAQSWASGGSGAFSAVSASTPACW